MSPQILWFASRATGAVSLVLFTAVMVLGIISAGRGRLPGLPRAGVLRLHRTLTLTSLAFLAIHVVSAVVDGYVDLGYWDALVPFGAGFDPLWIGLGAVAVDLTLAITVTSVWRRHVPARWWRALHLSAYAAWPLALLHGFAVSGGDGQQTWMIGLDIGCAAAVLAALGYRVRPDRHPDTVARRGGPIFPPRDPAGEHR